MSGHSKWAQIKRQKGIADIRRGQTFTKIANAITIAAREGGEGPRLRLAIEKARAVNMPKENVERAMERGMGKREGGQDLAEVVYEGFGPGGVSVIVEAATDNKQRTTSEIKQVFDKHGGTFASLGAVSYQFKTVGLLSVRKKEKSLEDIFSLAADAGAVDVEEAGEEVLIYTRPKDLGRVRDELARTLSVTSAELVRQPTTTIPITDKGKADKVLSFTEHLEQLDDVQKVYANFDIPDRFFA